MVHQYWSSQDEVNSPFVSDYRATGLGHFISVNRGFGRRNAFLCVCLDFACVLATAAVVCVPAART